MTPFLKSVAKGYLSRYDNLMDFCFVLPNKRSGTFFLKYLNEYCGDKVRIAPEVTTVNEFVVKIAGRDIDSRIDQIFTLYDAYRYLKGDTDKKDDQDFYGFSSWGEAALADFAEIDMYGVDPEALFTNVRDYKEIRSTFLTEEQMQVMEEYFGVVESCENIEKFWKHFDYKSPVRKDKKTEESVIKSKFMRLWNSLAPLYKEYNRRLEERNLTYSGRAYRLAVENIQEKGREVFECKKIVFVGLNVLSRMEWLMLHLLGKMRTETSQGDEPFADYVWDITGPVLGNDDTSAARYVSRNLRSFPIPEWLDLSESHVDALPGHLSVAAIPSNIMQAKAAGEIAGEICRRKGVDISRVAIVLPDENLLLPLMYSIPEDIKELNLTMGYPLRLTPTMSFVDRLKRLQLRKTTFDGRTAFFHEEVTMLLSHPFMQLIAGYKQINSIRKEITANHRFALLPEELQHLAPDAALIFRIIPSDAPAEETFVYLEGILNKVADKIMQMDVEKDTKRLERANINNYLEAIARLRHALDQHQVDLNSSHIFTLNDRLLAGETVRFEGKPLRGLQMMGLLETRAIDFDYLIIPSMNDKIMPRKARRKTFIPESLRHGYGLPSSGYDESIFAYYFYRMISRAKEVYMLYDARDGENRGGDMSRYLLQLKYLYAPEALKESKYWFEIDGVESEGFEITKTPEIIKELDLFLQPIVENKSAYKCFSASTLGDFCQCQMKFFFRKVKDISDDEAPTEFMDDRTKGTITHSVLEELYVPDLSQHEKLLEKPLEYSAADLMRMADDTERIMSLVTKYTNKEYLKRQEKDYGLKLKGDAEFAGHLIASIVRNTLRYDAKLAEKKPLRILGVEVKKDLSIPVPGIGEVNFKFSIDRLDEAFDGNKYVTRIVDYKTGEPHIKAKEMDEVFNGTYEAKNILQPLLYAHLYNMMVKGEYTGERCIPIAPVLYPLASITDPKSNMIPRIGLRIGDDFKDTKITEHTIAETEYLDGLFRVLSEIFNPSEPFRQTADTDHCRYCSYRHLCNR